MNSRDYAENAVRSMSAQQFGLSAGNVGSSQVASLNQRIEPTMADLIGRMGASNGRAAERADLAERLADLLCGSPQCGGTEGTKDQPPMSLLSQVEHAIDHGDQVNARIDAALHRISRRLTATQA